MQIRLKKISVLGLGFSWGRVTSGGVFGLFYPALGTNPMS